MEKKRFVELLGSKTVWTGVFGIVAAIGGYFTGEISSSAAFQTAMTCLIGIFLKDATLTKKE